MAFPTPQNIVIKIHAWFKSIKAEFKQINYKHDANRKKNGESLIFDISLK